MPSTDTREALVEELHDEAGRLMGARQSGIELSSGEVCDLVHMLDAAARHLARLRAAESRAERLQEQLDEERRMFPADGVWLVRTTPGCRRSERIHRVADLPDSIPLAAIAMRKDAIVRAVDQVREQIQGTVEHLHDGSIRWTYPAANDVAEAVIDHLYRAGEGGDHAGC